MIEYRQLNNTALKGEQIMTRKKYVGKMNNLIARIYAFEKENNPQNVIKLRTQARDCRPKGMSYEDAWNTLVDDLGWLYGIKK